MKTTIMWVSVGIIVALVSLACSPGGEKSVEPAPDASAQAAQPSPAAEAPRKAPVPVENEAQKRARIAVAKVTIDNLRTALSCYYQDVMYYPIGVAEKDDGNVNIVLALHDEPESMGGRGGPSSPYYEFKETDLKPSKHVPGASVLVDPWGTPWRYVSARDSTGILRPGMHNEGSYDLWSCGPNRKDEKGAGDDIANWKK
jgi:hypothetical protein